MDLAALDAKLRKSKRSARSKGSNSTLQAGIETPKRCERRATKRMEADRELDLKSWGLIAAEMLSKAEWSAAEVGFSSQETTEPSNKQTTERSRNSVRIRSATREKNQSVFHFRPWNARFRRWLRESPSQTAILYLAAAHRPEKAGIGA